MDFNGDRTVSNSDFTIFLSVFGTEGMSPEPEDCAVCYSNELFDADLQGEFGCLPAEASSLSPLRFDVRFLLRIRRATC